MVYYYETGVVSNIIHIYNSDIFLIMDMQVDAIFSVHAPGDIPHPSQFFLPGFFFWGHFSLVASIMWSNIIMQDPQKH